MKPGTFFTWFKKQTKNVLPTSRLDHKLIGSVNRQTIPSLTQLKYVGHFLSNQEKKMLLGLAAIAGAALLGLVGVFVSTHFTASAKDGGDYSEAMVGQPKYVNPIFASTNDIDSDLSFLLYTGLFHYTSDQQLAPDLAEKYTLSTDKKVYTVSLKPGIVWSDGQSFSADDVVYTFETIQNPESNSPLLPAFQGVSVEKIDPLTVRFTLKEPFAPFLNSLTVGIIPEHIWSDVPALNLKLAPTNLKPIGTGPWKFSKLIKDDTGIIQSYVLVPNDLYYGQKPHLKTLTFKFFADPNEAINAVQNQSVSAISFVPSKSKEKLNSKNLISHTLVLPQYTALFFNEAQNDNLKDGDLRKALAQALDKQKIVATALDGGGQVVDGPLLPGSIGYYPEIAKIAFDVDAANTLLDKKWTRIQPEDYFTLRQKEMLKSSAAAIEEATKNPAAGETASSSVEKITTTIDETIRGSMTSGQTFYRTSKDGKILSLRLTYVDTREYQRTALAIADAWKTLGIQTELHEVSSRQISKEVFKGRAYQILLYGEIIGGDPDLFAFWHSSQSDYPGLNLAQFSDRTADKLLEDARATTDPAAREGFYKKFQDILASQLPALFLFTPHYNFFVNKDIKGIAVDRIVAPSERYASLSDWYVKTTWKWKTKN